MLGSWMRVIGYSVGAAAVAGAAQVGVAEALGILRWDDGGGDAAGWSALLTWVAFIHAVAVLGGASVGRRAMRRPGRPEGFTARLVATFGAAVGAGIAGTLSWLPARTMPPPVNVDPSLVIVITAAAGIVAAAVIALFALSLPPVAGGVRTTVVWIWAVGVGCAVAGYVTHKPYRAPRLAVLDAPSLVAPSLWTGPYLMVAIGVLLAVALAAVARWGGSHRLGVALSGFGGPAVVAAAYLVAGPGAGPDRSIQFTPYLSALIAAGAGLIVSLAIALPGRRRGRKVAAPVQRTEVYEDLLPQHAPAIEDDAPWVPDWERRVPEYGTAGHGYR